MNFWQGVLLGLVQGLTEFLPVSSDGHLALVGSIAGVRTPGVFVEVALHVATLGSILVVYGRRFFQLAAGVLRRDPNDVRYAGLLLLGMIPAGVVGILFEDVVAKAFNSLWVTGVGFLVTGVALLSTGFREPSDADRPTMAGAIGIGCAQALAILPGVSRSGMTISSGIWLNMGTVAAADFSFLMAIPLIAGAGLFEARHIGSDVTQLGPIPLLAGCLVAFVSGVLALRFLVSVLRRGRLYTFAPYCFAVGLLTLGYALWHG